jgi:D-galactarolactone cycloisomerase
MKITAVEAYLLSFPSAELVPHASFRDNLTVVKRDALLVRISTDAGLFGYAPAPPCSRSKQAIDRLVAPFLIGRTLGDPDALRILFQQGAGADPEISRIYSSVEIALYDALGKERNLPVSELIGGRVRERIRLYASPTMYLSSEGSSAEGVRTRDLGFGAYKMHLAGVSDRDVPAVRHTREAVGPDLDLMVDAHAWWHSPQLTHSPAAVERLARELGEYQIAWLEEPLPPADHAAYAHLKQLDLVPLASGVHEPNELRYLDLIETGAVDYVQMDVVRQGGYSTARRMFPDVTRAGLNFSLQTRGTGLDVIAAGHLGVCWPESVVGWLEYPCDRDADILKQPLRIEHGYLIVPSGPGLGVEIDESVIWRYPWIEGPCVLSIG